IIAIGSPIIGRNVRIDHASEAIETETNTGVRNAIIGRAARVALANDPNAAEFLQGISAGTDRRRG
ncbi:MAG TPA: hypothetical protein VEU94_11090, partial [Terriglobales bacterium]|nr:hypothetical protein [Terriglobales bacterium]